MRFFFVKVAIPAMLFPCLFYCLLVFIAQVVFEADQRIMVSGVGLGEQLGKEGCFKSSGSELAFSNCRYGFGELISEFGGGIVEFSDRPVFIGSAFGETMVNQCSRKIPENSTNGENNNIVNTYWHPYALLLGFSVGAGLAIFVCDIYPRIRLF
ncbi:hypothetical protein [Geobacter sulfurreducens]|uniref:hypothetical protein n=1 Tax=Geobacter sulfurreducens TaxID=35554 RepID=UPI0011AE4DD0|nr:hypothetical protein [Geobacter sulfurreducens]